MKLTKKYLRENKIYNPHNLARLAGNKVYIAHTPASYGRISSSAHWQIVGIDFQTDPKGAWYNYGHKTFIVSSRQDKQPMLTEAIKWVKENFDLDMTDRDAFGDYHPTGTLDKLSQILGGKVE